ncbi:ABC transporter ATP-binding protein [Roseateles sp. DAIF2]|uniref:ABC transporter ATP-binding protein n=1 Tax=Roseateles sp. DAIF2 TaxID=2714952 RepID=UPI0018A2E773|nr:ABC transporter ATP-binding protein [Roseateles sp. DAIF2]QPF72902.1 ABC transporter ATP-binding protein [Roseateles sp. DAIF2]
MELRIEGLRADYREKAVLQGLDFALRPGRVLAIVGPNGCGKSTLLRCIARLHRPSGGRVLLGGEEVWRLKPAAMARRVGLLPQHTQAPAGITVAQLVAFGRRPYQGLLRQWSVEDEAAVARALAETDLQALVARPVERLSGGQRQRAWLAMVLAQETPWLLLDEPTSMLDLGHQVELLGLVRRLAHQAGRGVVMVLHDLAAAARYADELLALHEGQVLSLGAPREVVTPALVQRLYGVAAHVLAAPDDGAPLVVPALA